MGLLLDTHIMLAATRMTLERAYPDVHLVVERRDRPIFVSAASLWEAAIKVRLGKLHLGMPIPEYGAFVRSLGFQILAVQERHALTAAEPEPPTKDAFDRMLLAQCAAEDLRLVTVDRALADHPLAWRGD